MDGMDKRRTLAFAVLCVVFLIAGYVAGQPYEGTNGKTDDSEGKTLTTFTCSCEQSPTKAANYSENHPPRWYASPEWWLCILALPSLYILWCQMDANQKSSVAASDNAIAAKTSAIAQIASQRAWLEGEFEQTDFGVWNLILTNHGPTPAQLIRHERAFYPEGRPFEWESSPSNGFRNWGILIGNGKFKEPLETIRPDDFLIGFRQLTGHSAGASCTIGITITYTDLIEKGVERKTRFLMLYNRVSKTIERLSQYNEYT